MLNHGCDLKIFYVALCRASGVTPIGGRKSLSNGATRAAEVCSTIGLDRKKLDLGANIRIVFMPGNSFAWISVFIGRLKVHLCRSASQRTANGMC
jgi:hypothetical protein